MSFSSFQVPNSDCLPHIALAYVMIKALLFKSSFILDAVLCGVVYVWIWAQQASLGELFRSLRLPMLEEGEEDGSK